MKRSSGSAERPADVQPADYVTLTGEDSLPPEISKCSAAQPGYSDFYRLAFYTPTENGHAAPARRVAPPLAPNTKIKEWHTNPNTVLPKAPSLVVPEDEEPPRIPLRPPIWPKSLS